MSNSSTMSVNFVGVRTIFACCVTMDVGAQFIAPAWEGVVCHQGAMNCAPTSHKRGSVNRRLCKNRTHTLTLLACCISLTSLVYYTHTKNT